MSDAILRCEGICVALGGRTILEDVGLELLRGEVHVLIGPNGAGKTTLANALTGHVATTAGTVIFNGEPLDGAPWQRARRGVGRKFQVPRVFPRLSAHENLELANRRFAHDGIVDALEELGDTPGEALSHGSRQWLELEMVLSQQPPLLVLDEPTAGMPRSDRGTLARTILEHRGRATFLVVEHDLDFVEQIADRVSFMQDGRLVRTATYAEMRADATVRAAYMGSEAA